jgi:hypothetical protein
LFCSGRWFQGWRTRQRRSYFALKLPQGFWLIGADVQLGSDIDALQVDYFKKVAAQMQPGDRVIVCTAEPHWVYSVMYEEFDPEANEKNTQYLERVLQRRGASVVLYLAGDLHHYRRHEGPDGTQKITAGGGGAFLHPTHGLDASELAGGYRLKRAFPDEATSRRLCWRNLAFPAINPRFGVVAGSIYAFLGWSAAQQGLGRILGIAVLLMGFVLFTDTHSKWYRRVGGTIHGLVHTAAAFGLLAIARSLTAGMGERILVPELVTAAVLFFGGGLLGSWILGLYLLVSLNGFGRHSNEAFSALRIPDFKNFIRLHIDPSGRLSIFPFGIERVPRRWRAATGATEFDAQLEPDDPRATPPRSVEPAVTLARRGGA